MCVVERCKARLYNVHGSGNNINHGDVVQDIVTS